MAVVFWQKSCLRIQFQTQPFHKKKASGEKQKEHPVDTGRTARGLMFLLISLLPSSQTTSVLGQPSWLPVNSCTVLYLRASGHRSSLYLGWINNRTRNTRDRQSSCILEKKKIRYVMQDEDPQLINSCPQNNA